MTLCEELYFEITIKGAKSEIKKLVSFLKSGELDDFFEVDPDYINYEDDYAAASDGEECTLIFSNDDLGVQIDELDTDEFLELFCRAAKNLDVRGRLYDADDEEYDFISREGDSYYLNADKLGLFNDELDAKAYEEEMLAKDEDEDE